MKKLFTIAGLVICLIILIIACDPTHSTTVDKNTTTSQLTQTGTPFRQIYTNSVQPIEYLQKTKSPFFTYPPHVTPYSPEEIGSSNWSHDISPDNHWEVSIKGGKYPVVVTSNDGKILSKETGTKIRGNVIGFASWLPDNSGFVIWDSDYVIRKSGGSDRLIIYRINSQTTELERYVYDSLTQCGILLSSISWAPDGKSLAVLVVSDHSELIEVLDSKANVVKTIIPKINKVSKENYFLIKPQLTNDYLFYEFIDYTSPKPYKTKIFKVDLHNSSEFSIDLLTSEYSPEIVSIDPTSERFILIRNTSLDPLIKGKELVIFNYGTGQYEKILLTSEGDIQTVNNKDSSIVGIIRNNEQFGDLYFYYWRTNEFIDKNKRTDSYLEWDDHKEVFLLNHKDFEAHHYWYEDIAP